MKTHASSYWPYQRAKVKRVSYCNQSDTRHFAEFYAKSRPPLNIRFARSECEAAANKPISKVLERKA